MLLQILVHYSMVISGYYVLLLVTQYMPKYDTRHVNYRKVNYMLQEQ